jgi:GH15 family glucan-1,4-alpha-glucosidase
LEAISLDRLDEIVKSSTRAILEQQVPSGAFPASLDFSQYGYCWLRDGSFIAYALDRAGEVDAAESFHQWCVGAIAGITPLMVKALDRQTTGKPIEPAAMPPARFSLAGEVVIDEWPNFQVDGYGTWLWGLGQHLEARGSYELTADWRDAVRCVARYLAGFALEPCFDVWEESGGSAVHTSTLACVRAGLDTAARLLGDSSYRETAQAVLDYLAKQGRALGRYPKSSSRSDVDASTLWLAAPLGIVPRSDALMPATVEEIERTLILDGGVQRFAGDTYFGGGAWPVLTCSLGSYYVRAGRLEEARRCLEWTVAHIDADGRLGEQFGGDHHDPEHYREWVDRWGPPAVDLVWSHAMLVLLALDLQEVGDATTR